MNPGDKIWQICKCDDQLQGGSSSRKKHKVIPCVGASPKNPADATEVSAKGSEQKYAEWIMGTKNAFIDPVTRPLTYAMTPDSEYSQDCKFVRPRKNGRFKTEYA